MKTAYIVALAVGVPMSVAALATVAVATYKVSERNQACISYEKQLTSSLDKQVSDMTEARTVVEQAMANPFIGMALVPKLSELKVTLSEESKKANDLVYAFDKTCGDRKQAFFNKPEVQSKIDSFNLNLSAIKSSKPSY